MENIRFCNIETEIMILFGVSDTDAKFGRFLSSELTILYKYILLLG
jgi:hypothetical protein